MLSYGEMDDNNAATYTMQGINYNDEGSLSCDCVTFVMRLYDTCRTAG